MSSAFTFTDRTLPLGVQYYNDKRNTARFTWKNVYSSFFVVRPALTINRQEVSSLEEKEQDQMQLLLMSTVIVSKLYSEKQQQPKLKVAANQVSTTRSA